jgi:aerobic carbon-monoxide dehydrogenase large subunit
MGYIGTSVKRSEDPPLLTGTARFVGDIRRPGMLHAAVLRSPQGHARIASIDVDEARHHPGVVAVLTYADIAPVSPIPMRLAAKENLVRALQRPLAEEVVRYSGEPIAVVVAGSRYEAEDACELISVDYQFLEAVVDPRAAIEPGAPLVHDGVPDNIVDRILVRFGDAEKALAQADLVIEEQFSIQRHTGSPMETRGLVAEYDSTLGMLTVWGPTKVVHFNRGVLAQMLGLPEDRIRLIEPSVGGGFGIRGEFYPEDYLIPLLAMRLGRPVSWIEDRSEHLQAANHSREQVHFVRAGVTRDGRLLALHDVLLNNMGAYIRTHGVTVPSLTVGYLPGPYRIENYSCEAVCVLTNKTPTGTYRAPGRFEATFVRERVIDMIAQRLGMSRTEVRLRNLVHPEQMPYSSGTWYSGHATVYDSGDYPRVLTEALGRFGLDDASAWCEAERARGRRVGTGYAFVVEKSGMGSWEYGRVEIDTTGKVVVYTGAASVGQGVETALGQIVADGVGVRFEDVRVVHGDTSVVPYGMGTFAQRATTMAGNAAHMAAQKVADKARRLASDVLEVDVKDLVLGNGSVSVVGDPAQSLSLAEIARYARPLEAIPRGFEPGLSEEAFFFCDQPTNPYGVHLALVEVDPETGLIKILRYMVVYDAGRAINPRLVEGQLVGGVAQGIGGALYEDLAYDEEGQLIAGSFMDYLIPTAMEIPPVEVVLTEPTPSPFNPLAVKGAGEFGTPGVGAALANAVADALGSSAQPCHLPLTPERVRELASSHSPAVTVAGPR